MKTYCVGLLKGSELTDCHMATSDLKEAKKEAKRTNKNVYEKVNDKFFLRKIYNLRNSLTSF
jgi:hypothetical protein